LSIANRELKTFAYSVSHDLRAPLRAINGFSRMALERCSEQLDTAGLHYLENVYTASQRMSALIDALLSLSCATRRQLSSQRVDMSMLARNVTAELARAEPDRDVKIVIVKGDPVLLGVVLQNLLCNAWKFTSRLARARIEFGAHYNQHGPRFFVRDNGVGFDLAHSARLFAPFQRLQSAEQFPGTGIGLATVQRIIARHDGRIWADSALGKGATFYFTLYEESSQGLAQL
jgi:light-regulated signal transduction histidine kinase (bacteriophytochrome)